MAEHLHQRGASLKKVVQVAPRFADCWRTDCAGCRSTISIGSVRGSGASLVIYCI